MNEIIKINPTEYGLTENKAQEIQSFFQPMLQKMTELENDYNAIVSSEITKDTCKEAHSLRSQYVKVRTGTAKIHKELKSESLKMGRFIDSWKNAQLMASGQKEDKLKDIENHYINIEKKRIADLAEKRADELRQFEIEQIPEKLGEMAQSVYDSFLIGVESNYNLKIEAEKKEEERILEEQRLDKIEHDRYVAIVIYKRFWESEYDLREMPKPEYLELVAKLKKLNNEYEAKQAKIEAENKKLRQAEIAAEQKQKALAAELEKLRQAEQKALAEIEAEKSASDVDKKIKLIAELENIKSKYQFISEINQSIFAEICDLLNMACKKLNEF